MKRIYNKIYTRLFLTQVIKHKYDTGVLPGYYMHLIEYTYPKSINSIPKLRLP